MTEATPAGAEPAASTPGASDLNTGAMSAVEAQAIISDRIKDKAFGERLLSSDAEIAAKARREWDALHKAGYPTPEPVSAEAIGVQAAARNEEQWSTFLTAVRREFAIGDAEIAELRGGVIREEFHRKAVEEKDRLIRDKAFYQRLKDGDTKAREQWARLTLVLGLRPVKVA